MRISDWSSDVCSSDLRVFERAISMIKAIDFQQVQRVPYIFRRPFFARMCDAQQTSIPCCGEDPREFSGWVSYFRGIEPHANDSIEIRFGRPESFECVRFIQMAKKTEDQSGGQTVSRLGQIGRAHV